MILDKIIAQKMIEVEEMKKNTDVNSMIRSLDRLPKTRSLAKALNKPGKVTLLAEIKRSSPSKGMIREDFQPVQIAGIYTENGTSAISVLTDKMFFSGRPEDLSEVRKVSPLPILRKDFIIDPIQIYQSRLIGADAILLICSVLPPKNLHNLMKVAEEAGMETLVEVHNETELESACTAGAVIIGINNRNLRTFKTDINTTFNLIKKTNKLPAVVVSESGIRSASDMRALHKAGVNAALVGEAIMSAADIAAKVRELTSYPV